MTSGVAIPLHLAVHVLGLTVAAGLAAYALGRREEAGSGWFTLSMGALLLAVSHVVAGALVATDVAWPVYLRAAGYAGLALGSAGRLVGSGSTTVFVAAAPPGAYVAAAVAGAAAAVASVRGVLGRRRDAVLLGAGIALWAAADFTVRSSPVLAATLSLAGSATVGAWLLWRSRESVLSRIAASFLAALLVLVVGLASFGAALFGADLEADELQALSAAARQRADQVTSEWTLEVLTIAKLFSNTALADIIRSGDPARLEGIARTIAELPDADVVVLVGADGRLLASRDWAVRDRGPLADADAVLIAGDQVVQRALRGSDVSGLVVVGDEDVLAAGASPVLPGVDGALRRDLQAGVLVVARRVTDSAFLAELATSVGGGATVIAGSDAAASTLQADAADDVADAVRRGESLAVTRIAGATVFLATGRLESGGVPVAYLALTENAASVAGAQRVFARTLFLAALVGVAAAGLLAAWSASRTTRPVRRLTDAAERVTAGERDVRTGIDQPDEVGRLAAAFDQMTASLADRESELRAAAATEAALRARLEVLTASMGEALVAVDASGRVQTVNPAAERMLGVVADRAVGRPVGEVLRGSDGAGRSLLDALGGGSEPSVRAARGVAGDGPRAVAVAATAAPLRGGDGAHLGRVYVLRDMTGEAEVERMKTEFLSNISHELRTPLTPIRGYAEVMRRRPLAPEKTAEFAANIVESTARLERVIGMLVDFAALEANRLRVRPEPTDLGRVVDEVLARWRGRRPNRSFSRRLSRGLPPVHADPDLLARILEELLDNALKFSEGPVALLAEVVHVDSRPRVRLTVRDRGPGIVPEELHLIGRDFHQADGSATRQYGGLGLGLSLVYRIADRFGADVEIESKPGRGTDVHLLLPIAGQIPR